MKGLCMALLIVAATMQFSIAMPIMDDEAGVIEDRDLNTCQTECELNKEKCLINCQRKVKADDENEDAEIALCDSMCTKKYNKCVGSEGSSKESATGCYSELMKRQY